MKNLEKLKIPKETALKLLTEANHNMHSYSNKARFIKTTQSTGRIYINDLEKDTRYKKWSKSYEQFLFSYSTQILPIGLNFFNLILVCDINTEICWKTLLNTLVLQNQYPIHTGLIIIGDWEIATLILEGIRNLRKIDDDLAIEFLTELEFGMSPERISFILRSYCNDCELDLEYSYSAKRCQDFCNTVGICGPVQFLLNGRLLQLENKLTENYSSLEDAIGFELVNEKRNILGLAMRGILQPPLEAFFEKSAYVVTSERINLAISSISTEDVKITKNLPTTAVGSPVDSCLGYFYVILSIQDIDLASLALDVLSRYSDLPLQVKFLFGFTELNDEWEPVVCKVTNQSNCDKNEILKVLQKNNEEIQSLGLCTSCVIVNSRVLLRENFKNSADFFIAYETETSRLGVLGLSSILNDFSKLEQAIHTILQDSKLYPKFAVYRTSPIPANFQLPSITKSFLHESPAFTVKALVNIDSTEGSALIALLEWLNDLGANVTVTYAYSSAKYPVHRYYKYLIKDSFDQSLSLDFNKTWTYYINLHIDEGWLIRPAKSQIDLDNIRLTDNESVFYRLKSLLIQGQCIQHNRGFETEPPNGLQLVLANTTNVLTDTTVMKNFGYFQFQAKPGVFFISLAEGRSSDLFSIREGGIVYLKDIVNDQSLLLVTKNPEHLQEELLDPANIKDIGDTIHVFSLASGKLYERLLKIMIRSVMKYTSSKVKFWLVEDFFSPNFAESLKLLSKSLGFEYELLSYKWPSWLFAQTEKQRIIWGYKILFLDVLFPLKLGRVIYIDADQIVRADIKELWEMDLEGAPYAYTPFCESNLEAEDYMFWKKGYWKDHLKGLPYHISALYVVDLNSFRNLGAGDILRYFYETLSPNPDSLANLDQDLPNFAQHQLPIFSLPQEWLWCATWCSGESKKLAKSIDLCNNILTREHKIDAAKRHIPEWTTYDKENSEIELNFQNKNSDF